MLNIPYFDEVTNNEHPIAGNGPVLFWGKIAADGDAAPWKNVALGSLYIQTTGVVKITQKRTNTAADADWIVVSTVPA